MVVILAVYMSTQLGQSTAKSEQWSGSLTPPASCGWENPCRTRLPAGDTSSPSIAAGGGREGHPAANWHQALLTGSPVVRSGFLGLSITT